MTISISIDTINELTNIINYATTYATRTGQQMRDMFWYDDYVRGMDIAKNWAERALRVATGNDAMICSWSNADEIVHLWLDVAKKAKQDALRVRNLPKPA